MKRKNTNYIDFFTGKIINKFDDILISGSFIFYQSNSHFNLQCLYICTSITHNKIRLTPQLIYKF